MFIDAREVGNAQTFHTTVCIVGGGVAGITLALSLAKQQIDVCLIESGGLSSEAATDDLYKGENVGIPYDFDCNYRSRYLGGSSNCWGGWNRPLETEDFIERNWVPHSGWPLSRADLKPFYDRTHSLLALGPTTFESEFWESSINNPRVRRVPFKTSRVQDSFAQFSPPARMGKMYRTELESSRFIRVFLHANATNIATDSKAQNVTQVEIRTLNGCSFSVSAKYFVLATGGIENARLMLSSNQTQKEGLGNGNDLVGRYFMDHPRMQAGMVKLRKPFRGNKLYDIKHQDKSRYVYAHGTSVAAQFVLSPEVMEREQLLHSRVWFRSIFAGEGTNSVAALHRYTQTILHKGNANLQRRRDLMLMLRDPASTIGYVMARAFPVPPLVRGISLEIMVEPDPNPNSRVTLSDSRDPLGMRRVRVDWQLGSLVQKTFSRTLEILKEELQNAGAADIDVPPLFPDQQWPARLEGTWHHMGTTRMHDSAREGVVDRNCLVHGMNNLFLAGSSVFPTGGGNFPTMTLAALALRLADHMAAKILNPQQEIVSNEQEAGIDRRCG
ncbi:MAG: family oxidoreductase [Verrucomicrobiaceae bacterium]|nr:family oxidoreductase [Verrucomicrobiaceae bacterium]